MIMAGDVGRNKQNDMSVTVRVRGWTGTACAWPGVFWFNRELVTHSARRFLNCKYRAFEKELYNFESLYESIYKRYTVF
jgi:hypothetical protein